MCWPPVSWSSRVCVLSLLLAIEMAKSVPPSDEEFVQLNLNVPLFKQQLDNDNIISIINYNNLYHNKYKDHLARTAMFVCNNYNKYFYYKINNATEWKHNSNGCEGKQLHFAARKPIIATITAAIVSTTTIITVITKAVAIITAQVIGKSHQWYHLH